jgi:2-keto-3-deoxy-L-rhamnonate aldolase RhmA
MPSVRERLRTGKVPLAGFLNLIPSPVATQALAAAGADVVAIDQEHGPSGQKACTPWWQAPPALRARRGFGCRVAIRLR